MKYKEDRPFAEPEAAARQLLAIILARNIDAGQYADVGATNTAFPEAGGSVAEYLAGKESASRKAGSNSTAPEPGSSCWRPGAAL